MQQGELTVIGKDSVTIPLRGLPSKVVCHFKENNIPVPCNPHHFDELLAEVHVSNTVLSGFVLRISWSVSSVREVVFRVYY